MDVLRPAYAAIYGGFDTQVSNYRQAKMTY